MFLDSLAFGMMNSKPFKVALVFLCAAASIPGEIVYGSCPEKYWECKDGSRCIPMTRKCNTIVDCRDRSDELNCGALWIHMISCPNNEWKCQDSGICIPLSRRCDAIVDCQDRSDELDCGYLTIDRGDCPRNNWLCDDNRRCLPLTRRCNAIVDCQDRTDELLCEYIYKNKLITWFLSRLRTDTDDNNVKSHVLYRTVIALHLAHKGYFYPGNKAGENVASKVKSQLLSLLTRGKKIEEELALTIQALIVTCNDPRNFYGFNLVSKLRAKVNKDNPRPYDLLALCNARDVMTPQDAQKAADAFNAKNMSFTTDNKALALQALACIQSRTNFTLQGMNMTSMQQELKRGQFENGTLGNLRTTALVLQALTASKSPREDFNFDAALNTILEQQTVSGSFGSIVDSYYVMPLLSEASFLGINNRHCKTSTKNESNASKWIRNSLIRVYYAIKIGNNDEKTTMLYVPDGCTFYDVIELVNVLDSSQRVQYHVVDGKPYVWSLKDVQEDLERNLYWYTFKHNSTKRYVLRTDPTLIEKSPVDVKIGNADKFILWYK